MLLTAACGAAASESAVPEANPDWRTGYEEGSRETWIFALRSDFVAFADEVAFSGETTSPSGTIPYLTFDISTGPDRQNVPEELRLPSADSSVVAFESMGVERHPSVVEERQSDIYLLLGAQEDAAAPDGSPLPNLNIVAAFSSEDGETVEFQGPFADAIEGELSEAHQVASEPGVSDFDFLMALLTELKTSGENLAGEQDPESILGRLAAEVEARNDPELAWERAPIDERSLDPEFTPPEVLEGLAESRIFVANDSDWPPGTVFRLQTDLGISLQVDLSAGFSDGYVVLTPPETPGRSRSATKRRRPASGRRWRRSRHRSGRRQAPSWSR
ncbi:MAG TPA: hypothetical protein VF364_09900 [Candidatus Limnocylindria bacterium]